MYLVPDSFSILLMAVLATDPISSVNSLIFFEWDSTPNTLTFVPWTADLVLNSVNLPAQMLREWKGICLVCLNLVTVTPSTLSSVLYKANSSRRSWSTLAGGSFFSFDKTLHGSGATTVNLKIARTAGLSKTG